MSNFALTGIAGYIAPRHLKAIKETGNTLVAATDPHDSVGILDSYFPDVSFFREYERFDRHLEKLRRGPEEHRVNYLTICSPNHLHDAHIRLALRSGADAICEKPIVLNPWNLDALAELEVESGRRIWTVLQLRVHPALLAFKLRLDRAKKLVEETEVVKGKGLRVKGGDAEEVKSKESRVKDETAGVTTEASVTDPFTLHPSPFTESSPFTAGDANTTDAQRIRIDEANPDPFTLHPSPFTESSPFTAGDANTTDAQRIRIDEANPDPFTLHPLPFTHRYQVELTYITTRGLWYDYSWKGDSEKSGGIATNIGVHFFDLLLWWFGYVRRSTVTLREPRRMAGELELADADVRWKLSLEREDLPEESRNGGRSTYRSITVDGEEVEFTGGFTDLHTEVYRRIVAGEGFGIADAYPSIQLVHNLRG